MSIVLCPECGGKVSTTRKTCPHCGFDFSETKNDIKFLCPECESELELGVAVCPECGFVFDENKVQKNSEIVYPFDDFESNVISKEQLESGNYTLIVYEVKSGKNSFREYSKRSGLFEREYYREERKVFYVYLKGPNEINDVSVDRSMYCIKNATFKEVVLTGSRCNYHNYPDCSFPSGIKFKAECVNTDYYIIYNVELRTFEIKKEYKKK